jgi:anaerobic selenocysteine-containing dehydrogenase
MTTAGTIPTICRQCDMRCGIQVKVVGGRIVRITGLEAHPQNRGRLCPKGPAAIDTVYHPERLLRPLKKTAGGSFTQIPLEQAMAEIATRLAEIRDRHGARAIACWQGEALGFGQQEHYARRFMHALGSPNFLSCNAVCYVARYLAYKLVQGYWNPCPDFRNARLIVLWGANPPVSHFTFMGPIEEAKKRGARLLVIDPRKTEIARQADLHLMPWPGTDGALAWGWIRHLLESRRYDRDLVERHSVGFEELAAYARSFTPERVAQETGLDASQLLAGAEMIADSLPRVASYVGVSLEHQDNGVDTIRSIACLGGLCGAVDIPGGDPWPEGLGLQRLDLYRELPLLDLQPVGAKAYPVLYDLYHEPHAMTGIDAMLGEGPYPLRALIVAGGNPANTNPNATKAARALANLDLLVVRDLFHTETTELADYVLPAASFLERTELHVYSHHQWLSLSRRVLEIPGVADEYSFWRELAHRLGFGERYFPWESEAEVNRWLLEPTGINVEQLERHPEGLQYKPVRYCKQKGEPLPTPSGKFEFSSRYLQDLGYPALPEYRAPHGLRTRSDHFPLLLITGARKKVLLHSRYRNIPRFRKLHPEAEVEIHPADAARLAIRDRQPVRVSSQVGHIVVKARIVAEDEIRPGVLQVTHGWEKEANVNRLTADAVTDPVSGFPQLTSIPVRIAPFEKGDEDPGG